jgi:hypothetical protein
MKKINLFICAMCAALVCNYNIVQANSYETFSSGLTLGSTGTAVNMVQEMLIRGGYLTLPQNVKRGFFGPLTQQALIKWQRDNNITPATGYFGEKSKLAATQYYDSLTEYFTWSIGPRYTSCTQMMAMSDKCFTVTTPEGTSFDLAYIKGFEYEEGYQYVIKVKKIYNLSFLSIGAVISEISEYNDVLVEIVSKQKVGANKNKKIEVSGKIKLREGDCMPMRPSVDYVKNTPDHFYGCDKFDGVGVSAKAYIYKPISEQTYWDNREDSNFIPDKKPVKTIKSNSNGDFSVTLPLGIYTLLIDDGGDYICDMSFTGRDDAPVCPFIVGESLREDDNVFVIDHATY